MRSCRGRRCVDRMDDLYQTLRSRISQRAQARERVDMLDDALVAALAVDDDDRAWALVKIAAQLRQRGDSDRALLALDGADMLGGLTARAAAFTCAAGVHRDRGDLQEALKAGERAVSLHESDYALSALAAVYHAIWRESRRDDDRARWRAVSDRLDLAVALQPNGG